jgi:hypothetical protein
MRLTLTMAVAALGSVVFGLGFLLVPGAVASLYGIALEGSHQYARYFGSALLGFAAVLWLARKSASGVALRAILVGSFVASAIGLLVAVFEVIQGAGNALVWSTVVIYFLLALGFGDFVFRTPPPR